MAKKRSIPVPQKKTVNPNHVGTITREQQDKMKRASRRQQEILSDVVVGSGAGSHGGDKRTQNRRERKQNKNEVRKQLEKE